MLQFALRHPFARFLVVGCANFVVSFAAFYLAYQHLPVGERGAVANVVAYGAGLVNSFVLNRVWTFRAEGHVGVHATKFVLLNAVSLYRNAFDAVNTAYDRTLLASAKSIGELLDDRSQLRLLEAAWRPAVRRP